MSPKYGCVEGKVPAIPYYLALKTQIPVKVHPHTENTPILYGTIKHVNLITKTFVLHRDGYGVDVHIPYEKYDVYNGVRLPKSFPQKPGTSIILNHTILTKRREAWVDSHGYIYHSEDVYALIQLNPFTIFVDAPI